MTHWTQALTRLDACSEAVEWARQHDTLAQAWQACERPDWMLWLLAKTSGESGSDAHRALVLTACACARTALRYVPASETRPLHAIETTERWANGDPAVTLADVRAAYAAANANAAANAVAYAAANANAAANAVAYATAYANAAANADDASALAPARADLCALIRQRHPTPPDLSAKKERAA